MIQDHLFPSTIEEALQLKSHHGGSSSFLAGGTDLLIGIWEGKRRANALVDLTRIADLCQIERMEGDHLILAACLTVDRLSRSPVVRRWIPSLSLAAGQLGSPAVRNQATLGGNVVNASPAADLVPPLIAQGASVQTAHLNGRRSMCVEEVLVDVNRTSLLPDEIVTAICVPIMKEREGTACLKMGLREASTIAVASVAVWLRRRDSGREIEAVRITMGSVAPRVIRAFEAERFLTGKRFEKSVVHEAARLASLECSPISDIRASREYRKAITGELVETGVTNAWKASSDRGASRE